MSLQDGTQHLLQSCMISKELFYRVALKHRKKRFSYLILEIRKICKPYFKMSYASSRTLP